MILELIVSGTLQSLFTLRKHRQTFTEPSGVLDSALSRLSFVFRVKNIFCDSVFKLYYFRTNNKLYPITIKTINTSGSSLSSLD